MSRVMTWLAMVAVVATVVPRTVSGQILSKVQTLRDEPLASAITVAASPDGRHVYFAGGTSVALFDREPNTGHLRFRQRYLNRMDGVEGLRGVFSMALSPDGRHLYVGTRSGQSVVAFARDPASGSLDFLRTYYDGVDAGGLSFPIQLGFTPDGSHLFATGLAIGCSDEVCNFAPIVLFSRDPDTGELTFRPQDLVASGFSSSAVVSPDGRHVYTASGSSLITLGLDSGTHTLTTIEEEFLTDLAAEWVVVSPDGAHVYFFTSGIVAAFARDPQSGLLSSIDVERNGENGVEGLTGAFFSEISPDGRHLYVASDFHDRALAVFSRDPATGLLEFVEARFDGLDGFEGLLGTGDLAVSPDGRQIYLSGERGGIELARDPATGSVSFGGFYDQPKDDVEGLQFVYLLESSPDGRRVFAGATGSIASLARRSDSIVLEGATAFETEGVFGLLSGPTSLAASPDGRHLYVTDILEDATAHFTVDAETGQLDLADVLVGDATADEGLYRPVDLTLSPDGRHLYGMGGEREEEILAIFAVDPGNGSLSLDQVLRDEEGGDRILHGADHSIIDGKGQFLYVSGGGRTSLWERDARTGRLELRRSILDPADEQIISPDGKHRYSGSLFSLDVYSALPEGGLLDEVESYSLFAGEFEGLLGIRDLEFSPDGRTLYLIAQESPNQITALRRDPATGLLTMIGALRQGEDRVEGLLDVRQMAMGPEGTALHVAGFQEHVLSTFTPGCSPENEVLCLGGERFRVEVRWRDSADRRGRAEVVPFGTDDSALLWFFEEDNWEMLIKVLDGCALTGKFWVFAAATTDVEYTLTVTDTWSGATSSYFNPLGSASPAITDTDALASCGEDETFPALLLPDLADGPETPRSTRASSSVWEHTKAALDACEPGSSTLCLNGSRFRVEVLWEDHGGGQGTGEVVPFGSDDSGLFWFFEAGNWEMLVKVLDGCPANGHYWVFAAATTDVAYRLRITDTLTGSSKEYSNFLGNAADAIIDTGFFACGNGG